MFAIPETMSQSQKFKVGLEWKPTNVLLYPNLINHWQQFLLASLSKLVIYWIVWSPGIKESDTGLAAPSQWDLVSDKQMMQEEQPLQVQY